MSFMFEVYYSGPEDAEREARILAEVIAAEGRLDYRETGPSICLTYEFMKREQAEVVAGKLRQSGEHVEGPGQYAD